MMKKKLLILLFFFSFFFINPKPVRAEGDLSDVWSWIITNLNWFSINNTSRYSSNEPPLTTDKSQTFTEYTDKNNSQSDRSTPESVRAYRRGVLFYEILNEIKGPEGVKYKETTIKGSVSSSDIPYCPQDITTIDIICFYYKQQNKKILYTRSNTATPVDYDPTIMDKKCTKSLNNPSDCYINAYINYPDIPHGDFSGKKEASVISSNQFNDSIGTPLPDIDQGEDPPTDNDTPQKVKDIAKNTDQKEQLAKLNLITNENRKNIPCTSNDEEKNRQYLRDFHDQGILPASWKISSSLPKSTTKIEETKLPNYDCQQKGHGRGMSQHGALGMAMSGYNYHQILNSYYGTNNPSDLNYTGITFETKNEYENTTVTVDLVDECNQDNIDCRDNLSIVYSSCVNINNNDPIRFSLAKIKHPKNYTQLKNFDCNQSVSDYQKEEDKEEFNDWWNKSCTYQITLSLNDYLLGLAEIFVGWHIETHKALTVAARNIAYIKSEGFSSSLKNNSDHQVFRCKTLSGNTGEPNNQNIAVAMTKNEFMTVNGEIATTEYSSIHCGLSADWAYFDGTAYEQVGLQIIGKGTGNNYDGICYTNNTYQITTTSTTNNSTPVLGVSTDTNLNINMNSPDIVISGSEINGLFHFNDARVNPNHRISVNYDIATINEGLWLKPFSDNCYLDSRIFPALNQLINTINQQIPDNNIKFISCYRSISQQNELWKNALVKHGSQEEAVKYVALPGQSPHHTGRAIDFGDKNGQLNINSTVYKWLSQNGNKYGFYNYKPEPWHWEYNP